MALGASNGTEARRLDRRGEGFDRINAFRLFARKWGMWDAFYRNSRERSGDHAEQSDDALSWRKAFEDEFERCFQMVKQPDMAAVERAAKGENCRIRDGRAGAR